MRILIIHLILPRSFRIIWGRQDRAAKKLQLFLSDNDFYNTVQGVIFGDSKHPVNDHNNNVSLTIYYKTYTK